MQIIKHLFGLLFWGGLKPCRGLSVEEKKLPQKICTKKKYMCKESKKISKFAD